MKNLQPHHLFEPAFLWHLLLHYAHRFMRLLQNNPGKGERISKPFYLTERYTSPTNTGCIVSS